MTREQINAFLKMVGSSPAADQSRTGWVIARCPLGPWNHAGGDKTPSFGVRIEAGDGFANCFSCAWHGKQSDLVLELRYRTRLTPGPTTLQLAQALALIEAAEDSIEMNLDAPDIYEVLYGSAKPQHYVFPDDWFASFAPAWSLGWARDYLLSRGVPEEISHALDLRADTKQRRVCFPVRDFQGRLRGLHGRAVAKNPTLRYRMYPHHGVTNPDIWLGEHYVEFDKPIVVVEGAFDLTSVMRIYRNVVSPLFANPSKEKLLRMSDAMHWVTLLDRGTGGDKGRVRITQTLTQHVVTHLVLPDSKDPGAASIDELAQILTPHVDLDDLLLA